MSTPTLRTSHANSPTLGQDVAGQIVTLIRRHLGSSFFQYDASLVRDGCFYAGLCLARDSGTEDDILTCIRALEEMRWAFSKSEERIATLKWAWENRKVDEEERLWSERVARPDSGARPSGEPPFTSLGMRGPDATNGHSRPPRLNLMDPQPTVDAGPLTALSDGSWHTPSSASDLAGSHSNQGSPISDPALLMPAQDKVGGNSLGYYDSMPFDINSFSSDTAAGHFAGEHTQFFASGMGPHHTIPPHNMAMSHAPIAMAGHGMQASSAHGSTTLPSFSAQHYDAYYPHSNSSHR